MFPRGFIMKVRRSDRQNDIKGDASMAMVEWRVRADEFANCNCAYGCPCQFNALPTHGFCEAAAGWKIHEGHFGDVRLDGLNTAFFIHFPGPVHEGNGTIQLVIDERADPRQRDALVKIMSGEETEEMATMWWVFSAMSPNKLEPLFVPIELEVDVDARRGRLAILGLLEAVGERAALRWCFAAAIASSAPPAPANDAAVPVASAEIVSDFLIQNVCLDASRTVLE